MGFSMAVIPFRVLLEGQLHQGWSTLLATTVPSVTAIHLLPAKALRQAELQC